MNNLNKVPAQRPEYINKDLEKKAEAILNKHRALMEGLAKYD